MGAILKSVLIKRNTQTDEGIKRLHSGCTVNADAIQIRSVDAQGEEVQVLGSGKEADALWAKFAKTPSSSGGVAGYVFRWMSDKVFPKSPDGFDGPDHPLVNVPGKAITLEDGKTMLGAQELCGLETAKINGKLYRKRLLTPDEWSAVASDFGTKNHSTRTGALDEGVHHDAAGTRAVGQAKGHYVEYGGRKVYDMNGNVYEWTYEPAAQSFFLSGGSWNCGGSWDLRAGHRDECRPGYRYRDVGLRCGVSPQDSPIKSKLYIGVPMPFYFSGSGGKIILKRSARIGLLLTCESTLWFPDPANP